MTSGGSSIPEVRSLLTALATGRRAAEAGTAFGEGTRALALSATSVVTVEMDPERESLARDVLRDLAHVELVLGDWREVLPGHGLFGLLFLDSTYKKAPFEDGPIAVDLLEPGGILMIDAMTPGLTGPDPAREFLFTNPLLNAVEVLVTAEMSAVIAVRKG